MNKRNNSRGVQPRRNALVIALAMGLGLTGVAYGQATTGSIYGTAPVAAGETVMVSGANGVTRSVAVDSTGRYSISNLPVGTYTVSLQQNGKTVASRDNVGITPGGGTTVPFANSAAGTTNLQGVSVTASALPAIDVTSVNSSTTITAAQLKTLPVGRSAESIALLSPGAVAGSGYFGNAVSFGGAGVTENAYYVNGYNTGEPFSNIGGFALPYGAISQQQTFTGGYSAKYGRSDGGVINQVGKRGTNEWHFGAQVAWAPKFAAAGGKDVYYPNPTLPAGYVLSDPTLANTIYRDKSHNKSWNTIYSAYVGGPLIKDTLYMFIAAETDKTKGQSVTNINGAEDVFYSNHTTDLYGKIDWNINDSNVLEFTGLKQDSSSNSGATYNYDYTTRQPTTFNSKNNVGKNTSQFLIAQYTGYITDNATLSMTYGKGDFTNPTIYGNASTQAYVGGRSLQNKALYAAGTPVYGQITPYALSPQATNYDSGLRVDFDYKLGTHDLGVGIDNMRYAAKDQGQGMSGPGYAWLYKKTGNPGTPINAQLGVGAPGSAYYVSRYIYSVQTSMQTRQQAYYLQDVWQATDNLQLNLGVRNDRFTNYNDLGIAFADEKNQWEPRLGASWDVFGDSTFKVYGNAGRYYLALPDSVAERAANRSFYTNEYFTYTGIDANGVPTGRTAVPNVAGTGPAGPVSADFETGTPKDAAQVSASNLRPQYQDEYIVGFDKTLGPKWTYGAKLTYRVLGTMIDDACDDGAVANKITAMGLDPNNYSASLANPSCRLINPGLSNNLLVAKNDGSGYTNVTMTQHDWGFLQGASRKYMGLDLYLEHPFDGKWAARIDYTWSRSTGNAEGQVRSDIGQTDVSKTEDWDFWQLMDGAKGYLANDRRNALKARGSYAITPEWLVAGTLLVQTGTPEECLGLYGATPLDGNTNDPAGYGPGNYHYCDGQRSPPGKAGRTPTTVQLNLGVHYVPAFADHKLTLALDVYNVTNSQKAIQTNPVYVDGTGSISNTYQQGIYFQTPRYARFSISYDY